MAKKIAVYMCTACKNVYPIEMQVTTSEYKCLKCVGKTKKNVCVDYDSDIHDIHNIDSFWGGAA